MKYEVLKALEGGEAVSGQQLAKALCVSRNSVWKAINSLRRDGYKIDGQTNTGYTFVSVGDVICDEGVMKYVKTDGVDVHVYECVTSTITALKEWAVKGYPEGTVIIAERQSAGKGRLGRSFSSPKGTGLYMSILLRPNFSPEESLCITTAAAVAVACAVEKLGGRETKIKWVNDVFIDNLKICGILTEAAINFEEGKLLYAVLGIGINITEPEGGFPQELKGIAGAVFQDEPPPESRARLAALVIDEFFKIYSALPSKAYIEDYRSRSYLKGKRVRISAGNREETGTVMDVDDNVSLVLLLDNGQTRAFSAGEATILRNQTEDY